MRGQRVNFARSFVEWCRENGCTHVDDPGFLPSLELTISNAIRISLEAVVAAAVREILHQAIAHNELLQIDVLKAHLSEIVAKEIGKFSKAPINHLGEEL